MALSACITLALGLALAEARPPRQVALPPAGARCRRLLSMAGFSDNERAYAVREDLTCHNADGTHDAYALIDVIDAADMRLLARYQATPVTRSTSALLPVFEPPAILAQANPPWRHASTVGTWEKLRRGGHFWQKRHDFKDVLIRLRRDPDSHLDVAPKGTQLLLRVPAHTALGFTVVGRLVNGLNTDLGHFRDQSDRPAAHRAGLEAIFSRHGHLVATLFHGGSGDDLWITRTPEEQPIASTHVGFLQMLEWDADSVEELYGNLHPDGREVWKDMVGPLE